MMNILNSIKNKHIASLLILSILLSACKKSEKNEILDLKVEVMAIHDSIMPYMTKIYKDKEFLEDLKGYTIQYDSLLKKEIEQTIRFLKLAEDGMWEWMGNYDKVASTLETQPDSIQYSILIQEKNSIIKVKNDMINSMRAADSIIVRLK
jgi:uncharacterized lipoprotein YehR (DUF1307 family)